MGMSGGIVLILISFVVGSHQQSIRIRMVEQLSNEQEKRQRLGRYFSPEVARQIAESEEGLATGQLKSLSVLFTDLRNFTALSQGMDVAQVVPAAECLF